jgi:hypothetical protein
MKSVKAYVADQVPDIEIPSLRHVKEVLLQFKIYAKAHYRDSIKLRFRWLGRGTQPSKDLIYKKGDKIGQLVFSPFIRLAAHQTDSLETSERGTGGFGSTGV